MPPKTGNNNKRSGRMAKKGGQVVLQEEINNDDDWVKMLEKPGIYVVDVYAEWCGPCVPMVTNLKKIKLELGGEILHYAIAKSDNITKLERFRQKSEPHWMFFFDGKMVNLIIGANAPRLMKLIMDEVEQYDKLKKGEIQREFIPINEITDEERKKIIENEYYEKQKIGKEKKIRDQRMMKVREHALRQFSFNVPLKTCVVFFPHTIKYIMVEKPREEEEGTEKELKNAFVEPVMIEKRVCEVANSCALKYEELIVVEAKDIELTEDTLNEMFFLDRELLESFPPELIDQLLSKKVYSVMLSLPKTKTDPDDAVVDDDTSTESINMMGVVEQKTSMIIYGNGDPLNPSPNSLAFKNMVVDDHGGKIPSLYTPTNPLSKASALTVLFKKFCANNGYIAPQPSLPQYLVIFEINKSNIVLPIIEDLEDKIVYYGFFRSADPENPKLLCKDPELLITYGMDKVGKDAKLVLSVLKDDKDKSLLRFVDVGPIYVSPDYEVGIDDSNKYFPHDFDQMDGEVKMWLAARDEEVIDLDGEPGTSGGKNEMLDEDYAVEEEQQRPPTITAVG